MTAPTITDDTIAESNETFGLIVQRNAISLTFTAVGALRLTRREYLICTRCYGPLMQPVHE